MANKNPSPSTRIGAPNGPKPGKLPGQRALEIANAEIATRMRHKLLMEMEQRIMGMDGEQIAGELRNELLKLIKDAEDRGLGAPRQDVEVNATHTTMTKEQRDAAVAAAMKADE